MQRKSVNPVDFILMDIRKYHHALTWDRVVHVVQAFNELNNHRSGMRLIGGLDSVVKDVVDPCLGLDGLTS